MSLLMQALKKAERAKQHSLPEEELDKPSEAFDELLALTPQPAPPPAPAAPDFSLEPMSDLSLEPLAPPVAAAVTPQPAPSPFPAPSDNQQAGLTLDLVPDPAVPPVVASEPASAAALTAAPDGAVRAASTRSAAAAAAGGGAARAAAPAGAAAATESGRAGITPAVGEATRATATGGVGLPGATRAAASAAAAAAAAAATGGSTPSGSGDKPRAAARARARAAATAAPIGMDPERMRLIGLIAILVLLVGGFGIYYWRALNGPGSGANLPPVPMPPPGATGASPAQSVLATVAPNGAAGATAADPAADANDPMLAPATVSNNANQRELEARIARTEQELAATRQAVQAASAAAAQPRPEQLPVLTAPDNSDIRVARSIQPSPVSPTLDGAYQAFNSGDLNNAQQQYTSALQQDPNNRDALLGAAVVATRLNQKDQAASYYLHLLELSPNDDAATAGLIGLRQGDISRSESRLKAILAANPEAAPVQFALGNLYAQQGRWQDAQQAYFRAVGSAPDNPDYAYNLAIGLDRLNQPKLAITYYQRALALGQDKTVGFDRNTLRKRLHELHSAAP